MKATVVFLLNLAFSMVATHHHHLLLLLPVVASCPDVPSMNVDDACRAAAGTEAMLELCRDAMRDMTYQDNEVTLYELVAAKRALVSFGDTAAAVEGLLANASLPGGGCERDAYALCAETYREACGITQGVAESLAGCRFHGLGQRYRDGVARLESCRNSLMNLPSSPVYAMNLVDRNKAVLAYFVGRLIGGVDQ